MLISGIVGSKKVQLPAIACKVPSENQAESHIKQFKRWITHNQVDYSSYYLRLSFLLHHSLGLEKTSSISLPYIRFNHKWKAVNPRI